jgi:hypothetical protein
MRRFKIGATILAVAIATAAAVYSPAFRAWAWAPDGHYPIEVAPGGNLDRALKWMGVTR